MDRFFDTLKVRRATIADPSFKTYVDRYMTGYNTVHSFNSQNRQWLNNNHPLVRLVNSFDIDRDMTDEHLIRYIENNGDSFCTATKITNSHHFGSLHRGAFYSERCGIVSVNFEPIFGVTDWREIRPVRVLTHHHSQLYPVLPHQLIGDSSTDYALVGVDLTLLAIMYRHWLIYQSKKPVDERDDETQFIQMFVMPNMWPEQIDIAMRNRAFYNAVGIPLNKEIAGTRYISTESDEFDKSYKRIGHLLNSGKRTLGQSLENLPLIFNKSWYGAIPRNLGLTNQFRYWACLVTYTDWLYCLLGIVENLDHRQEDVYRTAMNVRRYIDGVRALDHAGNVLKPLLEERVNFVLGRLSSP